MPGRANNSGNGSNNQNRVNKNAAPRSNEDRTCRNCNKVGHLAKDCRSTTGNNAGRSNNNNGEKHCENHPHLTNHSTAECKIQKNKTKTKPKNNEDRDGDIKMDGFAYAASNTISNTNAHYCLICNSRSHYRNQCNNVAAAAKLTFSNCVCWKCHLRGHMGDDCENPSAKFCDRCHKSGHATVDCKSATKADSFRAQLALNAVRSERAFEVSSMTYPVTANAQPVAVAVTPAPTFFPTTPMQIELPAPTTFATPAKNDYASNLNFASFPAGTKLTPSGAQYLKTLALAEQRVLEEQLSTTHKQIRAHCEKPKYLYPKHKANNYIRDIYHILLENQILTPERLQAAHFGMAKNPGWSFWREQDTMGSISRGLKPVCNGCCREGLVLDKRWNAVEVPAPGQGEEMVDVRELEDYRDWGLFVVFTECNCCNSTPEVPGPGYRWIPRARVEGLSEMDIMSC